MHLYYVWKERQMHFGLKQRQKAFESFSDSEFSYFAAIIMFEAYI